MFLKLFYKKYLKATHIFHFGSIVQSAVVKRCHHYLVSQLVLAFGLCHIIDYLLAQKHHVGASALFLEIFEAHGNIFSVKQVGRYSQGIFLSAVWVKLSPLALPLLYAVSPADVGSKGRVLL